MINCPHRSNVRRFSRGGSGIEPAAAVWKRWLSRAFVIQHRDRRERQGRRVTKVLPPDGSERFNAIAQMLLELLRSLSGLDRLRRRKCHSPSINLGGVQMSALITG